MHGVFTALINGVHEQGEGGVLWVRGEVCTYCFPETFGDTEFAAGLKIMMSHPNAHTLFFVINEKDGVAHVVAYPRDKVYRDYHEELRGAATKAEEAARAEAERAERWANYQRAVAQHGLPQASSKKPVVGWPGEGDGWTEVNHTQQSYAAKRPVQASSYAAAAKQAQAKADAEAREAERMSEKQRKNRRKAEKAKEESARREAEQKARLAETIRQRAMS